MPASRCKHARFSIHKGHAKRGISPGRIGPDKQNLPLWQEIKSIQAGNKPDLHGKQIRFSPPTSWSLG